MLDLLPWLAVLKHGTDRGRRYTLRKRATSGTIDVIIGCMFSGKTTELIRRLNSFSETGYEVQAFKPAGDTRYAQDQLVSHPHDGPRHVATPIPDDESSKILSELKVDVGVVGIDEVQFFDPMIVRVCERLVAQGHRVIVAGLDTDFRCMPFGSTQGLIKMAKELNGSVHSIEAPCAVCGHPAHYTQRMVDGKPASADDPIKKIGTDDYEPRCEKCHNIEYQSSPQRNSAHGSDSVT